MSAALRGGVVAERDGGSMINADVIITVIVTIIVVYEGLNPLQQQGRTKVVQLTA
jgi:hypothetical protein